MSIRKYEPRRATPEEAKWYYLQYHSKVPDALPGSVMDKERYFNANAPGWLNQDGGIECLRAAA